MPAFLAPLLIGATIGAITNPDDRLRGALLGGTLGALTGGLGGAVAGGAGATQGALSAATAPTLQSGLGAAATEAGKVAATQTAKLAASEAAKAAAASPLSSSVAQRASLSLAQNPMQSLTAESLGALTSGGTASPVAAGINAGIVPADPGILAKAGSRLAQKAKDDPLRTSQTVQSALGGDQQQQAAPIQMAPIQQGQFGMPMSKEERLAMAGGDAPSFVPKGLFDQVNSDLDDEERLRLLSQELQMAGMV
jgi:hypothetical protein